MIEQLQTQALAAWNHIHPGKTRPQDLDFLIQSRDYIVIFWFDRQGNSNEPLLISKIPRTRNFNRYAERSVNLVDQLLIDLKPPVRDTLPTRVLAGQVNGLTHIVMGIMPGEPITIPADDSAGRRSVEQHLSAFLNWLVAFQAQAALGKVEFSWEEFLEVQPEETELDFLREEPYQGISQDLISRLPEAPIPFTWGYGDAHHSNILLKGVKVSGVIDWIGVMERTWFFTDWYYFLFFYALEFFKKNTKVDLDTQRRLAISTTIGVGDHWLTEIFLKQTRQFLDNYYFEIELNQELCLVFFLDLHWPQGKGRLLKEAYSVYSQVAK